MAEHDSRLIVANKENTQRFRTVQFSTISIVDAIFSRKSFFYNKLPSQPLRLSVLKLDGSSFEIQVSKTATISELKDAVEAVFSNVPQKGPGKISWAHVWGQFCLCYDGQKLLTEEDYLRNYGIKDGDQLCFIRHVSNSFCFQRKRLKKRVVHLKNHRRCRSSQVNSYQPKEDQAKESGDDDEISSGDEANENAEIKHHTEADEAVGTKKLTSFVGELFSYIQLGTVRKTRTKSRVYPSMISRCLLGSFREIRRLVGFGRRRHHSRILTWKLY